MVQLVGFLGRNRRWVLAVWVAALLVAIPFASRQTEHLTGGGDVPGSQSQAVSEEIARSFPARTLIPSQPRPRPDEGFPRRIGVDGRPEQRSPRR